MTTRVVTRIGDVFAVEIGKKKKYFQLIAFDLAQLNSDVIRAFKEEYASDSTPDLSEVVSGDVDFYAHCVTKWGVKLGFWKKVGKSAEVGSLDQILFRDTNDYGRAVGEEPIRVSSRWHVWRIGDRDFKSVGKLEGEDRRAEIGLVFNPESIVHRMTTGGYDMPFYPAFE